MKPQTSFTLDLTLIKLGLDLRNTGWWTQILAITLIYYLFSWLVLKKISMDQFGSPVWPAAGISVGLLLLWGRSRWLGVFLGSLCSNYINFQPILFAALPAMGTTIGSLISITLILRWIGTNYPLNQVNHVVIFTVCSLFTGTILQSLIGAFAVCLGGFIPWSNYLGVFWNWWIGDGVGILVFAPLVLAWGRPQRDAQIKSWLSWEVLIDVVSLTVITYLACIHNQPVEYLLLPPLLWSAFRFGAKLSTLLVSLIATSAAAATGYKMGVFYQTTVENNSLSLLQIFIGVISVTIMATLAIVAENRRAESRLHQVNADLEQRVFERTKELQESEAKAQELAAKAEAANQAKSAFIANMSHELRSPLNAVLGFSQLMLRANHLPPDQYENVGIIYRSGDYLLTLINHILDLSKIEAGKATLNVQDFDLYRLLDDLEDMLHLRASNAGLELIFNRAGTVPHYICADEVKLRQVLINLLTNAIKFTPSGRVILNVENTNESTEDVFTIDFYISDTGVGIAAAEIPKLFDAFIQAEAGREMQEGTGLGLAISYKFVQLMGGDIDVKSELGKGSTFHFYIQAKLGQPTNHHSWEERPRVLGLAPGQPTYKILAVDDKAINRQLLIKLLAPLGFDLKEASNGLEAIAIWDQWEPHLIWMDMRMPVMDGYEATKHIKSTTKGNATAIIALTASVLEEEKAIILSAGCDDFLRKPFVEQNMFDTLAKHLGVKYIYAENPASDVDNCQEKTLTSESLTCMPKEWISQLYAAALEANTNLFLQLLAEVPTTDTVLVQSLTKLARQFEFEQIVDLLEPFLEGV
ncbi:putative Histidine kinase [Richelia sinica FACHB-800]|uniref:Circadian input-output histidine kinase CikA n=1 Tax=Richelia sinica FACHB-800 TaxID=1357546 RepID=A0A975TC06_9NOST|nr:MASE1 domain-containing protein [Richelia sinica]MBD2665457.1 MASE1 domain-containing protein [Richelia sinica FACHB-800]QXE25685.1 putative Histidine kinase [Richelia sinica FACHB-800]